MLFNLDSNHSFRLTLATIAVVTAYIIAYCMNYTPPLLFAISILLIYFSAPPRFIVHPLNVLTGYYFLFYCLALMFGEKWQMLFTFSTKTEILTSCMNCATFLIAYNILYRTTKDCINEKRLFDKNIEKKQFNAFIPLFHIALSFLALCLVIFLSQFPLSVWLTSPGTAYQDRSGTGYAIIIIMFLSSYILAYGGYLIYSTPTFRKKIYLLSCYLLAGFFLYIPILSRPRLMLFTLLIMLPYVFFVRLKIKTALIFIAIFFGSVLLSSLIRAAVDDSGNFLNFLWNYCDIYYWTTVIVDNEPVKWFATSFIGFKKFLLGSGHSPDSVYTISQLFTEKYARETFGGALGDRTTIQFPIEVDMYINTCYIGAVPFLSLYFWLVGLIYRRAFLTSNMGWMFIATYVNLVILPSTLRGMLLEYTLVQNTLICMSTYFLLKKYIVSYQK